MAKKKVKHVKNYYANKKHKQAVRDKAGEILEALSSGDILKTVLWKKVGGNSDRFQKAIKLLVKEEQVEIIRDGRKQLVCIMDSEVVSTTSNDQVSIEPATAYFQQKVYVSEGVLRSITDDKCITNSQKTHLLIHYTNTLLINNTDDARQFINQQ